MDESVSRIACLQKELAGKEEDLKLSASIGKQLLEENERIKAQIEVFKQEKHSLQMNLDVKARMTESQNLELEAQKETCDALFRDNALLKKENSQLNRRMQETSREIEELQRCVEELMTKNNKYVNTISGLENQLHNCHKQDHLSFNETSSEEQLRLSQELSTCQKEKKDLLALVSDLESELCRMKTTEEKLTSLIQELQDHLNEKDKELHSYCSIIEKSKEENAELLAAIEILKLEQVDVKRRGNSIFGEVEDRRKAVEKEFIILREKYKALKENYEQRLQENYKLKRQFAIMIGIISKKIDSDYIQGLETNLLAARKEIDLLTHALSEEKKCKQELIPLNNIFLSTEDDYNYLRTMLQQSQKRIENLQNEVQNLRMLKLAETDKLIDTQHLLYHSEKTVESLKGEVLKMKLKIDELNNQNSVEMIPCKAKVELIPGIVRKVQEPHESSEQHTSNTEKDKENTEPNCDPEVSCEECLPKIPNDMHQKSEEYNTKKGQVTGPPLSDRDASKNLICKRRERTKYATAPVVNMNVATNECAQQ